MKELVVNDVSAGSDQFVDLDTGRLFTPPPEKAVAGVAVVLPPPRVSASGEAELFWRTKLVVFRLPRKKFGTVPAICAWAEAEARTGGGECGVRSDGAKRGGVV